MLIPQDEAREISDIEVVKRVQQGDKEAYNILVLRYQHRIFDVAHKYVNSYVDANDIAQEAFIRAYKSIDTFRGDSSFYTWLYRIAMNVAKSFLEHNQKYRQNVSIDDPDFEAIHSDNKLVSYHDSPDSLLESEELQAVINKAMVELSEDLRRALFLREVEGMSYEDIALVMNAPLGTVRSRIFRARQFIEEKMKLFSQGL